MVIQNDEILVKYVCNFFNCDYDSVMGDEVKEYVKNNPIDFYKNKFWEIFEKYIWFRKPD